MFAEDLLFVGVFEFEFKLFVEGVFEPDSDGRHLEYVINNSAPKDFA